MDVLSVLDELGIDVGRENNSSDDISCRCPLHDDRNPSFSINAVSGLWICYAGCGAGNLRQLIRLVKGDDADKLLRNLTRSHGGGKKAMDRFKKVLRKRLDSLWYGRG